MLSRFSTTLLVVIACCIGGALSYWLMSLWLDRFAVHTEITWGNFLPAFIAIALAFVYDLIKKRKA